MSENQEHPLPPPSRELPAGRHLFHKEQLMRTIYDDESSRLGARRRWFTRPGVLVPAFAALVVGGLAVTATTILPGSGASEPASKSSVPSKNSSPSKKPAVKSIPASAEAVAFLQKAAQAADRQAATPVRADQFIYLESLQSGTYVSEVGDGAKTIQKIVTDKPSIRREWDSPDGRKGWLIQSGDGSPKSGETLDYAADDGGRSFDKDGKPIKPPVFKGALPGSYDRNAELPHDPDALLKGIYRTAKGTHNGVDAEAFVLVGDYLKSYYPLPALNATLYRAAAKIPGVIKVVDVADVSGRRTVAIARDSDGTREEWLFDPKTYALVGFRSVLLAKQADSPMPAGTVLSSSTITRVVVVDAEKQVPKK